MEDAPWYHLDFFASYYNIEFKPYVTSKMELFLTKNM